MNVSEAISTLETDLESMIGFLSRIQQRCLTAHQTIAREFRISAKGSIAPDQAAGMDAEDWTRFLAELHDAFGSEWFTVGELAASDRYFTLPDVLAGTYERNPERGLTRAIGKAFRKRIGMRYGELELLRRFEKHSKQAQWKISGGKIAGAEVQTKPVSAQPDREPPQRPSALIDRFIRERCEVSPDAFIRTSEFSAAYMQWHLATTADPVPSRNELHTAMRLRGYMQSRSRRIDGVQARTIEGIRMRKKKQQSN